MLAKVCADSQIQVTLPKELVDRLNLSEGDELELYEKDGMICIVPVIEAFRF
jgi:AbrB family looped-hinge helix DNA binding protein